MTQHEEIEACLVELEKRLESLSAEELCKAGRELIAKAKRLHPYDSNCIRKFGFADQEQLECALRAAHGELATAYANNTMTADHLRPLINVVKAQNECVSKQKLSNPEIPSTPSLRRRR